MKEKRLLTIVLNVSRVCNLVPDFIKDVFDLFAMLRELLHQNAEALVWK